MKNQPYSTKASSYFRKKKRGASGLSYALLVGLIAVVALSAITKIGGGITDIFDVSANKLGGVATAEQGSGVGGGASNTAPTAGNVTLSETIGQGSMITVPSASILVNSSDIDVGDTLTISGVANPVGGTVTLNGGDVDVTANVGVSSLSFDFTVSDGNGGTDAASASMNVSVATGIVFTASNSIDTASIYTYDGTTLSELYTVPVANPFAFYNLIGFIEFQGEIYFALSIDGGDSFLYKHDGITATAFSPTTGALSGAFEAIIYNGDLYFSGDIAGGFNEELVRYDGTSFTLVAELRTGSAGSSPNSFVEYNGLLYFQAHDGVVGQELYVTDGTTTNKVAGAPMTPFYPVVTNGLLYFTGDNDLYSYDGSSFTAITTVMPGGSPVPGINPFETVALGSQLIFNGRVGGNASDREIFVSDGSTITQITNIAPGANIASGDMAVYNGYVYFRGSDSTAGIGSELYRTDGTTASLVADIYSGAGQGTPHQFAVYNGKLYFNATDGTAGRELYSYDGSTVQLEADVIPGTGSSYPLYLTTLQ